MHITPTIQQILPVAFSAEAAHALHFKTMASDFPVHCYCHLLANGYSETQGVFLCFIVGFFRE